MHCQSISAKQHLPFHNTELFICSILEVIIFVLLIFSDEIIALLEVCFNLVTNS